MSDLVIGTLAIVPLVAWRGYALSVLWTWFAVPIFHLPTLTIPQALGVAVVVGMLTHQTPNEKQSQEASDSGWVHTITLGFLNPLFFLAFGWVVMRLM